MKQFFSNTNIRTALACLLLLLCPVQVSAQTQNCDDVLVEANNLYSTGSFDATIALLDQCLERTDVTEPQRMKAYRLKGLSFIGKGLETDAKATIRNLLSLVPNYEADPVMDPPNFVELITQLKQEFDQDLTAVTTTAGDPPLETVTNPTDPSPALEEVVQEPATEEVTQPALEEPTTQPNPPQASKRKKGKAGKWIIGGIGIAAAGALAAVLLSGGGGNSGSIASPPELP